MSLNFPITLTGKRGVSEEVGPCDPSSWSCYAQAIDPTITYTFNGSCGILNSVTGNVPNSWRQNQVGDKHLIIGTSTTTLGNSCFRNSGLLEVTLPDWLTDTGYYPFYDCSDLHTVNILGSMTTRAYMFRFCNSLTRVNVCTLSPPSGFVGGSFGTFADCPNLTEVHVPVNGWSGVTIWFGLTVVKDLPAIEPSPANNTVFDASDNVILTKTLNIPGSWQVNKDNIYKLTIGNECVTIGSAAFRYCDNIGTNNVELNIPDTVTTIGDYAFQRNYAWDGKPLRLGNSVVSVGTLAFLSCNFGGDLVIPDSLTTLPTACFQNHKFTTIHIGSGLTNIPGSCFKNNQQLTELNIPNTVTTIGGAAFQSLTNCTGDLVIPDSVTGTLAGFNDSGFTGDIVIGNNVTTIGSSAFSRCGDAAGTITLGSSLQTIGSYAFRYCYSLTGDLVIPSSVTSIGTWVWGRCDNLEDVHIDGPASIFTNTNAFLQYPTGKNLYVTSTYLSGYDATWKSAQGWTGSVAEWTSHPNPMP